MDKLNQRHGSIGRREFLKFTAAGLAMGGSLTSWAESPRLIKKIPVSGESLPVIGLGTSRTFNVDTGGVPKLVPVMQHLLDKGLLQKHSHSLHCEVTAQAEQFISL